MVKFCMKFWPLLVHSLCPAACPLQEHALLLFGNHYAEVWRKIGSNSELCRSIQPQGILRKAFDFSPWRFVSLFEFSAQATS